MEGVYYELMKTNKKRVIYSYFMDTVVISKLVVENFVTPKWLFSAKNDRKMHFFSKMAKDIRF